MSKTKILAFVALILLFSAISSNLTFAADVDYSTAEISSSNLSEATFEAEAKSDEIENDETAELKISLELLRAELAEMKSGMKQLQAKVLAAEMDKLSSQLAALQKEIADGDTSFMKTEIPKFDFDSTPAPSTLQVTKIEDFVDFDLKEEISKNEKAEATEETEIDEIEEDSELVKKLESAEAEIAELRAALEEEEELGKDKAAHTEVIKKTEEIKATKNELEKVTVEDAMQKLEEGEIETAKAELKKPSNIIAPLPHQLVQVVPAVLALPRKLAEPQQLADGRRIDVVARRTVEKPLHDRDVSDLPLVHAHRYQAVAADLRAFVVDRVPLDAILDHLVRDLGTLRNERHAQLAAMKLRVRRLVTQPAMVGNHQLTRRHRGRVKLVDVKAPRFLRRAVRFRRLPPTAGQKLRLGLVLQAVLALLALEERFLAAGVIDGLADDLHAIRPDQFRPSATVRALEVEVLLGARQVQLVDAVLGNGRGRDRQNVLLDLARQPLQGQPHCMGIHLVQLVQDQLGHGDGLQVAVAT
ncbi:MAG: hypothetical protein ABIE14_03255, partial [Patescibacteria group bacterium]